MPTNPQQPYTCRENELFKQLDAVCQDYTEAEIIKALGRKLHWMSGSPPTLEHIEMVTEGHQLLRGYVQAGMPLAFAYAMAAGWLASLHAHYLNEPLECPYGSDPLG